MRNLAVSPVLSKQLFFKLFQPATLRYDKHVAPLSAIIGENLSRLVSTLDTPIRSRYESASF